MARKILVVELFVVILLLAGYFFFSRNTQVNNLAIRKISLNSCYQFNLIIGHIASAGYDCIYFSTDTIPRKNDLIYQVKGRILNAEWEGCDSLLINSKFTKLGMESAYDMDNRSIEFIGVGRLDHKISNSASFFELNTDHWRLNRGKTK